MNDQERTTYWWKRAKDAEARLERIRRYVEKTKQTEINIPYIVSVTKGEDAK